MNINKHTSLASIVFMFMYIGNESDAAKECHSNSFQYTYFNHIGLRSNFAY